MIINDPYFVQSRFILKFLSNSSFMHSFVGDHQTYKIQIAVFSYN